MKLGLKCVSMVLLCAANLAMAEDLDKASKEALGQTVDLLKAPKGQEADKNLDALGFTAKQKNEVYGLTSQIFEQMVKETNGDPEKMKKLLLEAMKDPDAFAKKWTPEQKAKLKDLSEDLEKSGKKVKKP